MVEMKCLRCGTMMEHINHTKLQLGKTGWILRDLPNLAAGALPVDIFYCSGCGKLEFFHSHHFSQAGIQPGSGLPQRLCPECGIQHDFDCPKCPLCGYDYYQ